METISICIDTCPRIMSSPTWSLSPIISLSLLFHAHISQSFGFFISKPKNMSETKNLQSSYPPPFRHPDPIRTHTDPPYHRTRAVQDPNPDPIPVVDLQSIDPRELREVCLDWGVFRLVNHGVPLSVVSELQETTKKLFSLPFEAKQALFKKCPISYFWGSPALTPSGTVLSTKGTVDFNWVEGFNVPVNHVLEVVGGDSTMASFGNLLQEYSKHLSTIATRIFEAIAKDLKLVDLGQSRSMISEPTGILRVYRYPPCVDTGRTLGMDEHTDSSVLSILSQDLVGGLEVFKNNKWINVKPIPNTLVVNFGDMMQAISDDACKSVKHRVKVNMREDRISICYFVFPEDEFVIRSSKYRPFCYDDFRAQVQEDIKTIGTKVGLERFKLKLSP